MEYTQRHSCSKLLNDNTELLGNWSEAADKVGNVWIPKMEAAGLRQAAWIYSPNTFAKLAAEKRVDITSGNLNIRFFDSKAEGAEWLESDDA